MTYHNNIMRLAKNIISDPSHVLNKEYVMLPSGPPHMNSSPGPDVRFAEEGAVQQQHQVFAYLHVCSDRVYSLRVSRAASWWILGFRMSRKRSSSMDIRSDFKAFASEFDLHRGQLKRIVLELEQVCEKTRGRKEAVPERAVMAAGGAGVAAGGGLTAGILALAPLTAGLSLVAAGIAAGAAAAGVAVAAVFHNDKITDEETVKKVKKLLAEFYEIVGSLRHKLEDLKTSLKDLNRDTENLVRTQTRIQDLSSLLHTFNKQATVERLLEVKEQCNATLQELLKLRSDSE
ncbi:hypothetical protein WMY93_021987 [Mugilogobius chulae]|uniref:Uncharacterized protein n=1 Tax=Mugilogobius chulae TaxID=88201 RepID=A0AAW0NC88_9GOBI